MWWLIIDARLSLTLVFLLPGGGSRLSLLEGLLRTTCCRYILSPRGDLRHFHPAGTGPEHTGHRGDQVTASCNKVLATRHPGGCHTPPRGTMIGLLQIQVHTCGDVENPVYWFCIWYMAWCSVLPCWRTLQHERVEMLPVHIDLPATGVQPHPAL